MAADAPEASNDPLSDAARPLIDLIDTLRSHGVQQDLPLPQIAVMGDQSAGKSSVLEAISGVPFPRGTGLVTRCATQLIMSRAPKGAPWKASAAVEPSDGDAPIVIAKQADVAAVIEQLTAKLCERAGGAFSTTAAVVINLRSPDVPDLTLLDLPGIVRTAVAGQQQSVIGDVNGLIETYLKQERTIVLAVIPANQDVATIDILDRAKGEDPDGMRTIAVLTKPDLIDEGAEKEVLETLLNQRAPLKLGYAMVRCRNQRENEAQISMAVAREREGAFFDAHAFWGSKSSHVPPEQRSELLGVDALTGRLSSLLVTRIRKALPAIKYELQNSKKEAVAEYARLGGDAVVDDASKMRAHLVEVVTRYAALMRQTARGNYGHALLAAQPNLRLFGRHQVVFKDLKDNVSDTQPAFDDERFTKHLAREMHAFRGRELPGFTNSQVFYGFMVKNIEDWRPFVEDCRAQYVATTIRVSDELLEALAPTYPALVTEVRQLVTKILEEAGDRVQGKLDDVFVKESDPYTTNESMLELVNQIRMKNFDVALRSVLDSVPPSALVGDDVAKKEAAAAAHVKRKLGQWYMATHGVNTASKLEDMCTLLEAYWDVATKRLVDNVCMTLEHDFSNFSLKKLEESCFLFAADAGTPEKQDFIERLFLQDPRVVAQRRAALEKKARMEAALEALGESGLRVVAERANSVKIEAPKALAAGFVTSDRETANAAFTSLPTPAQRRASSSETRAAPPPPPSPPARPPPPAYEPRVSSPPPPAVAAAPAALALARDNPDLLRAGLTTAAENPELFRAGANAAYENRDLLSAGATTLAANADLFSGGGLFGDGAGAAAAPADTGALADKFGDLFGDG